MKRCGKVWAVGVAVLAGGAALAFVVWAQTPFPPGPHARAALASDSAVLVVEHADVVAFEPVGSRPSTALLFYPGARVDFRAYAPALRRVAAHGYLVVLVRVRLNLALLDVNAGAPFRRVYPQITCWAAGGHSLGGVAAARFAEQHPEVKQVVFWASYPADDRLKSTGIKVLSVYGTEDGLLDDGAKIERYKPYEPSDTRFVALQGGNHAQFGDYGFQPGDHPATISADVQGQQAANVTSAFLAECGS